MHGRSHRILKTVPGGGGEEPAIRPQIWVTTRRETTKKERETKHEEYKWDGEKNSTCVRGYYKLFWDSIFIFFA